MISAHDYVANISDLPSRNDFDLLNSLEYKAEVFDGRRSRRGPASTARSSRSTQACARSGVGSGRRPRRV